jgi:aromatic-L-amino-acid decarboxylase
MSADELRRWGHATVDWVADYLDGIEQHRVVPDVEPGDVRSWLPPSPPELPESFDAVLADLDRVVVPGTTHWQHPGFHAFFPANTSGPAILGDIVSSGLGTQGMLWQTGPACTEVETHLLDWMVEVLGLPKCFLSTGAGGGVIQDSASSATLCALLAARERALARPGATIDRLTIYTSTQAHSSLEKGARISGLRGPGQVRMIDVDDAFALRPDLLAEAVAADQAAGRVPCMVMATIGTTSSLAVDPIPAVADIAQRAGMWLHVDAAMAGSAAVCPELRGIYGGDDGLGQVDSYVTDPHKWLFTTFDCSLLWVADRSALVGALSILPEYLRNQATESGAVIDYRDWHVPLGRRFRSLKLWFVLRWYGVEGLRHHVREHVRLARELSDRVTADPRLELAAPTNLNLVCFRHVAGDEATEALHRALNATGRVYLTHTRLAGRYVLRASIGAWTTEQRHVDALWRLVDELASPRATTSRRQELSG